ncbi:hypothetical protein BDA99DRAFT_523501 [Phascolomyces articulosus]|uniref:Uncharacterized protein n=1 Tax=Phascolomyces articulosus TaxID=60185 RepID=A0AAD5JQJ7_9FUNG|nr:hypothetical protein BDA99DRAFT_523501 [Phascolomyces articulosus]
MKVTVEEKIKKTTTIVNNHEEMIEERIKYYMYKPSEILTHLLANPKMSPRLSALPDFTHDQRISLAQGDKWKECPLFRHPMLRNNHGVDLWVGDFVLDSFDGGQYKITSFLMVNNVEMALLWSFSALPHEWQYPSRILLSIHADGKPMLNYLPVDQLRIHPTNNVYILVAISFPLYSSHFL